MRPSSIILLLLLTSPALTAQSVPGSDAAAQVTSPSESSTTEPQPAIPTMPSTTPSDRAAAILQKAMAYAAQRACPVRLSVDRRSNANIILANGLSDWANRHRNLSLDEQQRTLQAEPGFRSLSPTQQQEELDELAQFYYNNPVHQAQGLNVTISRPGSRITVRGTSVSVSVPALPVLAADIVVYGYPPGLHVILVNTLAPKEITESFHLTARDGEPQIDSSIWTTQLAVIKRIEVTHIAYADGTSWQSSAESHCTGVPSPLLLVDSATR